MFRSMGALAIVDLVPFKFFWRAIHPLTQPDRLLNGTKFPIGISYGDRDFLGSEGADIVVRTNAFFKSGESQLFKIPNAGHFPHIQNPTYFTWLVIGFFNGTIKGKFE